MEVQRNHTAPRSKVPRRRCSRNRRRRRNELRNAAADRRGTRAANGALFGDRKLGRRGNHGTRADVQLAERTSGRVLDAWRRRNDGRLRRLEGGRVRNTQVGWRSDYRVLQRRRIPPLHKMRSVGGRGHDGTLQLGSDADNIRSGGQRDGRNRQPWLLHAVRPCHDVGQSDVVFQLDVWWRDDRLRSIVGFGRNRNNRLARKLRVGLRGLSLLRAASIEWWKIFRGSVIDHLSMIEGRSRHHLRLQSEKGSESEWQ